MFLGVHKSFESLIHNIKLIIFRRKVYEKFYIVIWFFSKYTSTRCMKIITNYIDWMYVAYTYTIPSSSSEPKRKCWFHNFQLKTERWMNETIANYSILSPIKYFKSFSVSAFQLDCFISFMIHKPFAFLDITDNRLALVLNWVHKLVSGHARKNLHTYYWHIFLFNFHSRKIQDFLLTTNKTVGSVF